MILRVFILMSLWGVFLQGAHAEDKRDNAFLSFDSELAENLDKYSTVHVMSPLKYGMRDNQTIVLGSDRWANGVIFLDHWNFDIGRLEFLPLTGSLFVGREGALLLVPKDDLGRQLDAYVKQGLLVEHLGQILPFHFYYSERIKEESGYGRQLASYTEAHLDVAYDDFRERLHEPRVELTKSENEVDALDALLMDGISSDESKISQTFRTYNSRVEKLNLELLTLIRNNTSNSSLARKFSFGRATFEEQMASSRSLATSPEDIINSVRSKHSRNFRNLIPRLPKRDHPMQRRKIIKGAHVRRM